jgi:hypothetical protein
MSVSDAEWRQLRRIMSSSNLAWMFERNRDFFLERLDAFAHAYAEKTTGASDTDLPKSATIGDLIAEHKKNPHRVKTLLQATAFSCSPEILAMVWVVLMGSKIKRLSYEYKRLDSSQLTVEVRLSNGASKTFVGRDHEDAAVLRLIPLSKVDGKPLIESFYPLQIPKAPRGSSFFWILEVLEWIENYHGSPAFCPSLVDPEHVREIADAIVDGVKRGWLEPESGGPLAAARADTAAEDDARERLASDAAVVLALTSDGRRALRRGRFYRQLRPASVNTLVMVRKEIERVLANPSHESSLEDLEEIRDELSAIDELLHEAE